MRLALRVPLALAASVAFASTLPALPGGETACGAELAKLLARDGATGDCFGSAVALDGDTALVGAQADEEAGPFTGAAYVLVREGSAWVLQAKLLASDLAPNQWFGRAVALEGDTAVVGAIGDYEGSGAGSVYVFERSGTSWTQTARLAASDGLPGAWFGGAVALSGDTLLVGAGQDGDGGAASGSAYVFVRNGGSWLRQAKLVAFDAQPTDVFGSCLALEGDVALIGAPLDDDAGQNSGSVYVFERSGGVWSLSAKRVASDGTAGDRFGSSVALSGDRFLVGAVADDEQGEFAGSAYVFARGGSGWSEEAKLRAADGGPYNVFGASVVLDGDVAFVGASSHPHGDEGVHSGAVYLYLRDGAAWSHDALFVATDAAANDYFGIATAYSDGTLLVGAYGDDDQGSLSGSAYVYAPALPSGSAYCTCAVGPCGNHDAGAGCANSTGAGARLEARGSTSPDEVNLLVTGGVPDQAAVFFQADGLTSAPFGDGTLCANGGVIRLTQMPRKLGADGSAAFGPCSGDATISSLTGVVPGSGTTKRYQLWYRDPSGPCGSGFNSSNGYEIVW